jgi:hypothetical protein
MKGKPKTKAMRRALPVYSVDTVEEAKAMRTRFCRLGYDGRHLWTDFPVGDVDALDNVSAALDAAYRKMKKETA